MKTIYFLTVSFCIITLFSLSGCDMHNNFGASNIAPDPPTGVYSINGDNRVDIFWNASRDRNVAGYNVYYSNSYDGKYTRIGTTVSDYYTDFGAKNGRTYYYAVASYDYDGNESDLSQENVYNTPRPEGMNQVIFDYKKFPNNSGYDFSNYSVTNYQDKNTDFFFENSNGIFYLVVWDDTDIQDLGKTTDIYDISEAPLKGWSPTKDTTAVLGHTYVIWTWDNHYAKIRVKNITNERVTFDWAYQTVEGNQALKRGAVPVERKPLTNSAVKRRIIIK